MNKYFTKRGIKKTIIDFDDEKLDIEVKIPTNKDHDEMMDSFSEVGADGMLVTHGADFVEDRLVRFIVNLPFEVPTDSEFQNYKEWIHCNNNEKKIAINCMDPKLRDIINNVISGIETITDDDSGN